MPRRATVSGGVRSGASRARDAGQGAFDRLTQSLDAAQAALNDLRKELSKGTRDVLQDLDTTLKERAQGEPDGHQGPRANPARARDGQAGRAASRARPPDRR